MIFYVSYTNFSFPDSLENAVSEHLEWLEFQHFSGDFAPKNPAGELIAPPRPPVVLMTAYGSAKVRYP